MNKYNNGKIYMIMSLFSDDVYIGSTTKELNERLKRHEYTYKMYLLNKYHYVSSYSILKQGNYDIFLIEKVNVETKEELLTREKFYIINTQNAINKVIPMRTEDDKKQRNKHYEQINKDKIYETKKIYRLNNKTEIYRKQKIYRDKNKESISEKGKQYYEKRKKELSEKYICLCSGQYTKQNKFKHEKTMMHLEYMKNLNALNE